MKSEKPTSLSKCCKNCGSEFELIIPEKNRIGSSNSLRRVFCNDKCKNQFGRNKKEGKVNRICKLCDKTFLSYPSQKRSYCSRKCQNESKKIAHIERKCECCGNIFEGKPSDLNVYFCSRECFHKAGREIKTCITCKKQFEIKKSDNHIQRCSRQCQFVDQSNGKIKLHLNGRTGYRIDLGMKDYFKSALEADFARFLEYFGIQHLYENKTFITNKGAYTPDFFLPDLNLFVELKGVENNGKPFEKMMTKNLSKHQSVLEQGCKIITITQKEFITGIKTANLWSSIPNLEQRNYKKTQGLVVTHENQKNQQGKSIIANQSD